jgi:ABC-type Fe3+/spermidine/putrescine transport system ATPase subunit
VLLGAEGTFMVRPEKIRVLDADDTPRPDDIVVAGEVIDVQYLGSGTRYRVDAEADGVWCELIVDAQSTDATSTLLGHRVQLAFARVDAFRVPDREISETAGRPSPAERKGVA